MLFDELYVLIATISGNGTDSVGEFDIQGSIDGEVVKFVKTYPEINH